jgi:kynurenine formamidase
MPAILDPVSGLKFYELSHRWGYNSPTFPGYEDVRIERITYHAKHGVMTQKINAIMHVSTHVNAPIHLIPGGKGVGEIGMDAFFGSGVILGIPKKKWELITASDLEKATPAIEEDDIVIINTQWHHRYADSQEYFGHAPGLSKEAAEWLVRKKVKLVGVDSRSPPRSARIATARRSGTWRSNTRTRPARTRRKISRIGTSRIRRSSRQTFRPSRIAAAISMR